MFLLFLALFEEAESENNNVSPWLATVCTVQKSVIFRKRKKKFSFVFSYRYDIDQWQTIQKIEETTKFLWKPINIDLLTEKYYSSNNIQHPKFLTITRLDILRPICSFIKSLKKLTRKIKHS